MTRALTPGLVAAILALSPLAGAAEPVAAPVAAGYVARKLPLPADILPSCMAVRPDGTLVVGSMDGDILLVTDSDGDGLPDRYTRWAGTLPHWPLGLRAEGDDVLVSTRGALLRLSDRDRDGWAERWRTLSDAWDVSRDHHDWTTGIAPWPGGGWVVCPVTDDTRDKDVKGRHYLRGKAVRVAPDGATTVLAEGLRFPTGWATRRRDGAVFFTDNQGQQKTTCEINRLVAGGWYGYPSRADSPGGPGRPVHPPGRPHPVPVGALGQRPGVRRDRGPVRAAGGAVDPLRVQQPLHPPRQPRRGGRPRRRGPATRSSTTCSARSAWRSARRASSTSAASASPPGAASPSRGRSTASPTRAARRSASGRSRPAPTASTWPSSRPPPTRPRPSTRRGICVRRYHHVFQGSYHSPPTDEEALHVASATARAGRA